MSSHIDYSFIMAWIVLTFDSCCFFIFIQPKKYKFATVFHFLIDFVLGRELANARRATGWFVTSLPTRFFYDALKKNFLIGPSFFQEGEALGLTHPPIQKKSNLKKSL